MPLLLAKLNIEGLSKAIARDLFECGNGQLPCRRIAFKGVDAEHTPSKREIEQGGLIESAFAAFLKQRLKDRINEFLECPE